MRGSRASSGGSATIRSTARRQLLGAVENALRDCSTVASADRSRRNSSTRSTLTLPPTFQRLISAVCAPAANRSVTVKNRSSPGWGGIFASPLAMLVCQPGSTTHRGRLAGGANQSATVMPPLPPVAFTKLRDALDPVPTNSSTTTSVSSNEATSGTGAPPLAVAAPPPARGDSGRARSSERASRATVSCAASGRSLRNIFPA